MSDSLKYLIFTDLDATLLDHDTYSWDPAVPALSALKVRACPVILNSSKTLREMVSLAAEIQTEAPLVCENGALVAIPKDSPLLPSSPADDLMHGYHIFYLGKSRAETLSVINSLRSENPSYEYLGYQDWTVEQVAAHTGLPLHKAEQSKDRLGTEPIHWHGTEDDLKAFQEELSAHDLTAVLGGRFIHVAGRFNKATGVKWLLSRYQETFPKITWKTVALGDSPNDTMMLNAAEIAITIPNHTRLDPTAPQVIHATEHGPTGWNTEILSLINAL